MKVAVIGAGLSGLTLAEKLKHSGFDVSVFDKARGVAGRMTSKSLKGCALDIGAQYFTADTQPFREQVSRWQSLGLVEEWSFTPRKIVNGKALRSPDTVCDIFSDRRSKGRTRFAAIPGMSAVCKRLAANLKVQCNQRVTGIRKTARGWVLDFSGDSEQFHPHPNSDFPTCSSIDPTTESLTQASNSDQAELTPFRRQMLFDHVVLALPAQQAAELLAADGGEAQRLAHSIPPRLLRPCYAVGIATTGNVDKDIQGIFGDDIVSWAARASSKPGRRCEGCDDVWVLHFAPQYSAYAKMHGRTSGLVEKARLWLERAVSAELRVVDHYSHFWRYANSSFDGFSAGFLSEDSISVIGDWCAGGKVEGAYTSALKCFEYLSSTNRGKLNVV